ncbi:MAG: adenosylcobinamide-GDP ribazoletransferase [Methanosarcinales archaeon]|jgi:adenosylcobinamide-GDP ribazoletransferase|nr:adenosylcobinamide-GDP ribazoletransferase [Methanosarcinales archaeon]
MTIWQAFKAGFGFLSVIPVGITMEGIEALMKRLYMYPIVGFCLGILIGVITFIAAIVLPTPLTIIAIMFAVYGIIWFNHLDGIADMGDGMTAHGSLEKKRKALKDMSLGIGGVAFAVLLMLFFYASLSALENVVIAAGPEINLSVLFIGITGIIIPTLTSANGSFSWHAFAPVFLMAFTMICAETNGKQAMLTISTFGKSFSEGLGSMTIAGGTSKNFAIGIIFTAIVSFILLGLLGLAALIVSTIAAFIILKISNRHFKGLNGDGIGAANEVGRIVTIATVAVILFFLYGGMIWTL